MLVVAGGTGSQDLLGLRRGDMSGALQMQCRYKAGSNTKVCSGWQVGVHASAARALLSRMAAAGGSALERISAAIEFTCAFEL